MTHPRPDIPAGAFLTQRRDPIDGPSPSLHGLPQAMGKPWQPAARRTEVRHSLPLHLTHVRGARMRAANSPLVGVLGFSEEG